MNNSCIVCECPMHDDPDSLYLACGDMCRWCAAQEGDEECRSEVIEILLHECIVDMTTTYQWFKSMVEQINGDPGLFETRILEDWRPWHGE